MNQAIENMMKAYKCQSQADYVNALKEIIQEIALLGLWRSKFFERAAFYGGTALRKTHLKTCLVQSGHWPVDAALGSKVIENLLIKKMESLNIGEAKQDVMPFIEDEAAIAVWSTSFFKEIITHIKCI